MGSDPKSFKDATSEPSSQEGSQVIFILFYPTKYMHARGRMCVLL